MTVATAANDTPTHGESGSPSTAGRTFALVGNPNSGKSTLFNKLTGLRQKVGNYPGVTIERKEGFVTSQHGQPIRLIDLPGAYSLSARSLDEAILQDVLLGRREDTPHLDGIVCVLDASNLERNLYLATQMLELGLPVIIVLNMMDLARDGGIQIDVDGLARELGTTIVVTEATNGVGLIEVRLAMSQSQLPVSVLAQQGPPLYEEALQAVVESFKVNGQPTLAQARGEAYLHLTQGVCSGPCPPGTRETPCAARELGLQWSQRLNQELPGWKENAVGERYARIGQWMQRYVQQGERIGPSFTDKADRVLLHPIFGWLVLLGVLGGLFWSIFSLAATPMDWIDGAFGWIGAQVASVMPEGVLQGLVVDGIIAGVGGVVIFLPQILMLFFFLGLLEGTGYMARAAFILDRLMGRVGLSGRAFLPLLSAYACAIPGVMATRTISSNRERLATIMVAPFMSCTARLPVYFVMIPVLVGASAGALTQAFVLLAAYLIGTAGAFLTALVFRKTLLKGGHDGQLMELPPYRIPSLRTVVMETLDRGWVFIRKAGTIILGLSILIWVAMTYPQAPEPAEGAPEISAAAQAEYSAAGRLGKAIEPVIEPLGYDWQIGIGVLASFAAREVFVSTLAIAYGLDEDAAEADEAGTIPLIDTLRAQTRADGSPVFTLLTCLSILVFFIFALQCMATVAVVKRETNSWRWPLFQLGYMTAFAYLAALVVYQGGKLLGFA
ncbi:MAG: ferrous iron transport protein B [Opitutales bacterium]